MRWPGLLGVARSLVAEKFHLALHCIGVGAGAVVETPLHRHEIAIPVHLNEIQ